MIAARPLRLVVITAALAVAAGAVLWSGSRRSAPAEARSLAAQRLLGGLGGGAATDLATCPTAFDPTLDDACAFETEPAAGLPAYCPFHAGVSLGR